MRTVRVRVDRPDTTVPGVLLSATFEARFHQWGTDVVETAKGFHTWTVAIVEARDGTVSKALPENIKFID